MTEPVTTAAFYAYVTAAGLGEIPTTPVQILHRGTALPTPEPTATTGYVALLQTRVIGLADIPHKYQTLEVQRVAVELDPFDIIYAANLTRDLCELAVTLEPEVLKHVPLNCVTDDMIYTAGIRQPAVLKSVSYYRLTLKLRRRLLDTDPTTILHFQVKTDADWVYAIARKPELLKAMSLQTEAAALTAVSRNGLLLAYVDQQTPAVCLAAVQQNRAAYQHVSHGQLALWQK